MDTNVSTLELDNIPTFGKPASMFQKKIREIVDIQSTRISKLVFLMYASQVQLGYKTKAKKILHTNEMNYCKCISVKHQQQPTIPAIESKLNNMVGINEII